MNHLQPQYTYKKIENECALIHFCDLGQPIHICELLEEFYEKLQNYSFEMICILFFNMG